MLGRSVSVELQGGDVRKWRVRDCESAYHRGMLPQYMPTPTVCDRARAAKDARFDGLFLLQFEALESIAVLYLWHLSGEKA